MNPPPAPPRRGASSPAPVAGSPPGRGEGGGSSGRFTSDFWRCSLSMNLGGVRVPSNPDLFWRSSMSGLDGFRLGDYSSERVSPHRSRAQGRNSRTKFGVFSFWQVCSPAFRRHRVGESNACELADTPPAEAGTTYRNTGSSRFRGSEAKKICWAAVSKLRSCANLCSAYTGGDLNT